MDSVNIVEVPYYLLVSAVGGCLPVFVRRVLKFFSTCVLTTTNATRHLLLSYTSRSIALVTTNGSVVVNENNQIPVMDVSCLRSNEQEFEIFILFQDRSLIRIRNTDIPVLTSSSSSDADPDPATSLIDGVINKIIPQSLACDLLDVYMALLSAKMMQNISAVKETCRRITPGTRDTLTPLASKHMECYSSLPLSCPFPSKNSRSCCYLWTKGKKKTRIKKSGGSASTVERHSHASQRP